MKQTLQQILTLFVLALTGACSDLPEECLHPEPAAQAGTEDRIVFGLEKDGGGCTYTKSSPGEGVTLEFARRPMELPFLPTKVNAVTTLPSFEVLCTDGAAGNENLRWRASFNKSSDGSYTGDQYWPVENPSYHFYASNATISYDREGSYVVASNDRDVVGAFLESPRYKERNNLAFKHLFARLGRFTVTAEEGKTISDVDIRITPRKGGNYDLRKGTWSRVTVEDPVCISPSGEGTRENDLYLVPGSYTLSASWTVWDRGFSTRKERICADITLPAGEVTDISTVLGGDIVFPMLTLECLESGTIYWKGTSARTIEYSKDDGNSWTQVTATADPGTAISVATGDVLLFKGDNENVSNMPSFDIKVRSYIYGDITSLVNGTGGVRSLNTSLASLFRNCTGLENHPTKDLIFDCATLAVHSCCQYMFGECSGLTRAPDLPAATLSLNCYNNMFYYCTRLTQVPAELPAMTMRNACYASMFAGCSSLRTAPRLPATTLADFCYSVMFSGCSSLEEAPELPAHFLPIGAYVNMFDKCSSLRYIKCLATTLDVYDVQPTFWWVDGVASQGRFIKHPDCTWWESGRSGIPEGWTVTTATE